MAHQLKNIEISPASLPPVPSSIEDEKKRPLDGSESLDNVPYLSRKEKDPEDESSEVMEDGSSPYLKIAWKYKW